MVERQTERQESESEREKGGEREDGFGKHSSLGLFFLSLVRFSSRERKLTTSLLVPGISSSSSSPSSSSAPAAVAVAAFFPSFSMSALANKEGEEEEEGQNTSRRLTSPVLVIWNQL